MSIVSALKDKLVSRKSERTLDYSALVDDTARGIDHDPGEAESILQDAGKTVEDFEGDLEIKRKRFAWREQFDASETVQERAHEAELRQNELTAKRNEELHRIHAKFDGKIHECDMVMANASAVHGTGRMALRRLIETAPAEVLEAEGELRKKLREHQAAKERMRDKVSHYQLNVTTLERQIEGTAKSSPSRSRYESELEVAKQHLAEAIERFEFAQRHHAELSAEMNEIQARKLDP